jgi:hypothetical protein
MYTPQKMLFYACFMPQNRPMPGKCKLSVWTISHGHRIFAQIQVGGGGKATKQGESAFTAKMQMFNRRLSTSQTSEHFFLN